MSNLKLRAETTEPEKRVVMEERRLRSVDNPWGALYEETNAAAFRAHPYMWPVIGWMHDIESATLDDIRGHYETYYSPNNAIASLSATSTRIVHRASAQGLRRQPIGRCLLQCVAEVEPPQLGERRVIVKKEANLPAFVWAYKVPNVKEPRQRRARGVGDDPFRRERAPGSTGGW